MPNKKSIAPLLPAAPSKSVDAFVDTPKRRVQAYLPDELFKQMGLVCVERGVNYSEFIDHAVRRALERRDLPPENRARGR